MEGGHRRFGSLGKPDDFAKCIVGRPLARFSWRQGSIPINCWSERTVHCIFKHAKHVLQCEDADGVIVESQHPKTDSGKLACIGYLYRQRDRPYLEPEGDQSRGLYTGRSLLAERCDVQPMFHCRKHESTPDLES